MKLTDKLKGIRQNKGLTQVQVANKANIAVRMYQCYENEGRVPKATTAIDIANALDTTVETIWGGNPKG